MKYEIKREYEHFVVYINGNFYCTADTRDEAEREVDFYFDNRNLQVAI